MICDYLLKVRPYLRQVRELVRDRADGCAWKE